MTVGASSYYAAVLVFGVGLVRHVGIPRDQRGRLRRLTVVPYFTGILLAGAAGLLNPLGTKLLWQSALPATAGGQSGLLWWRHYIPRGTEPKRTAENLGRRYSWILGAGALAIIYVAVLGPGVTLHR